MLAQMKETDLSKSHWLYNNPSWYESSQLQTWSAVTNWNAKTPSAWKGNHCRIGI